MTDTAETGWQLVPKEPTRKMCPREQDAHSYRQALASAPPPPAVQGEGNAEDAGFVAELKRLYDLGCERGNTGGSARDEFWDTLDLEVGRLLDIAERAGAIPAVMPGREEIARTLYERQTGNWKCTSDLVEWRLLSDDLRESWLADADAILSLTPQSDGWREIVEDARRYRRLQVLGCAPSGSDELKSGQVQRFTNLDAFVDADLRSKPSRGEAKPLPSPPQAQEKARAIGKHLPSRERFTEAARAEGDAEVGVGPAHIADQCQGEP